MKKVFLIIISLFIIIGCSRKVEKRIQVKVESLNKLDSVLYSMYDKSLAGLIREYGQPEKTDTGKVPNRYTGNMDYVYTLHYDNYDIIIYHAIELNKYLLQSVLLKSDNLLENYDILFGSTENNFKLLAPVKKDEINNPDHKEIIYSADSDLGYESLFVFYFRNNSLYQVKYNAPID